MLRSVCQAAAPALFGYVSEYVFTSPGSVAGGSGTQNGTAAHSTGLEYTFLIFLVPLLMAGLLSLTAVRTYPGDVATAAASIQATSSEPAEPDEPSPAGANQHGAAHESRELGK